MPPIIIVDTTFKIAENNGNTVVEYEPGEYDVEDRTALVAVEQLYVAT